jgi:hypothetical protein
VFFIYCIHFLKSASLNLVVQLIQVEAGICAVCICNMVGNGEWLVSEEVGDGKQPVGYEVGNCSDCNAITNFTVLVPYVATACSVGVSFLSVCMFC